jgi:hypothetical protein
MARHDSAVGPATFVANGGLATSVSGSKEADMRNPWKVATLGVLALGAIVGTSTLTTAYLLRPPASQPETTPAAPASSPAPRAAVVRVRPAPLSAAVITPTAAASEPAPAPAVVASTAPSAAADCDTGGDRAVRIAKPGALGALLGAGLGAAGGAIAKGGQGAGQGALIGGLAGAAVGAGYGAYKTKTECGTVFGDPSATSTPSVSRETPRGSDPAVATGATAPFSATPPRAERIQIYDAR